MGIRSIGILWDHHFSDRELSSAFLRRTSKGNVRPRRGGYVAELRQELQIFTRAIELLKLGKECEEKFLYLTHLAY